MMFAIIPNLTRKNAAQVTRLICAKLDELGAAYSLPLSTENVFSDTKAEFLPEKELLGGCEAVITVGGDGPIIHSAKKAAVYSKPVLGINAGRLAFMAGLEIHELDLLEKLITGDYSMDKRMMLKTTATDGDRVQSGYNMNDSTVMRPSRLSKISEINVDLNGNFFNRYLGDGLIVSTPTGSTAYSLSAGGPVVDPKLECMILTPICSHSVFTRSLVLGDDAVGSVEAGEDSLVIHGGTKLQRAAVPSYDDHRMAMSLAILGAAGAGVIIERPDCVRISYPEFYDTLAGFGGE